MDKLESPGHLVSILKSHELVRTMDHFILRVN